MSEHVKMSVLAKMSGVPAPTIKHYIREGLLPQPAARTSRNMAYYDPALVPRIQRIKELQRTRFLPLGVIKRILDEGDAPSADETVAAAIARVLAHERPVGAKAREELAHVARELEWLERAGVVVATRRDGRDVFEGDDLELLRILGASRSAGLDATMLPMPILVEYVAAIRALVDAELRLFREGVVPRAGDRLSELTEVATLLSERLVIALRRKMLLPTLAALAGETPREADAPPERPAPKRRKARAR